MPVTGVQTCALPIYPFFCGCTYDVITQATAIHLDSAPARYEYMAPPTPALAEPVATGGKAPTAGATDAGTTGDSYSCLFASGAASESEPESLARAWSPPAPSSSFRSSFA
jgi:hypothetical protein